MLSTRRSTATTVALIWPTSKEHRAVTVLLQVGIGSAVLVSVLGVGLHGSP